MTAAMVSPSGLSLPMLLALVLGGCATQASRLVSDVRAADNACRQQTYKTESDLLRCFSSRERPLVAKDLPRLLPSYDTWNSARATAAYDFDHKVALIRKGALATYDAAVNDNVRRFNLAVAPVWSQNQLDKDAREELDRASTSACMRDNLYISASMTVNIGCLRDARTPVIERRVPAISEAYHEFWDRMLVTADAYDKAVLPNIERTRADFLKSIEPARQAFYADTRIWLQVDAAETARQREEVAQLLTGLAAAALVGATAAAHPTPSPIIETSCTTTNGITNCLSY